MKLQGKVAIITGSGRGIGKAIAQELASEGARVMLCSRTEHELKIAVREMSLQGWKAQYCVADVCEDNDISILMETTVREFGGIDILVTAAGVYGPMGLFHTQDLIAWRRALDVNLMGPVRCVHAAIPYLLEKGGVITAVAGAGVPRAFPRFTLYSAAKAGLVQFMTTIAAEYMNIRFNAVAPGPVATKLIDEVIAAGPHVVGEDFYEKNVAWKKGEGGVVSPNIAAKFIARLCSPDCKITGKYLSAVWDADIDHVPAETYTLQRIDGRNFLKKIPQT